MRILHIVGTLNPGGIERICTDLAIEQKHKGYYVSVCTILRREGIFMKLLEQKGIKVIDASDEKLLWNITKKLIHCLLEFKPDIVHSHVNSSLLWQALAVKRAGKPPFIVTHHSLISASAIGRLRSRIFYRIAHPHISLNTAVSQFTASYISWFYQIPLDSIKVIYNGIHVSRYSFNAKHRDRLRCEWGILPDDFVWCSVGRLDPVKGHDKLLEAFTKVMQSTSKVWLVLVGDGPLKIELQKKAERLGCSKRILWLGRRSDIAAILSACDGYVQASRKEALSIAILEALASGLQVVATEVGGVPEIASLVNDVNNKTIHLVPVNDVEGLVRAMQLVVETFQSAHYRISFLPAEFSFENMFAAYEAVYHQVV